MSSPNEQYEDDSRESQYGLWIVDDQILIHMTSERQYLFDKIPYGIDRIAGRIKLPIAVFEDVDSRSRFATSIFLEPILAASERESFSRVSSKFMDARYKQCRVERNGKSFVFWQEVGSNEVVLQAVWKVLPSGRPALVVETGWWEEEMFRPSFVRDKPFPRLNIQRTMPQAWVLDMNALYHTTCSADFLTNTQVVRLDGVDRLVGDIDLDLPNGQVLALGNVLVDESRPFSVYAANVLPIERRSRPIDPDGDQALILTVDALEERKWTYRNAGRVVELDTDCVWVDTAEASAEERKIICVQLIRLSFETTVLTGITGLDLNYLHRT